MSVYSTFHVVYMFRKFPKSELQDVETVMKGKDKDDIRRQIAEDCKEYAFSKIWSIVKMSTVKEF